MCCSYIDCVLLIFPYRIIEIDSDVEELPIKEERECVQIQEPSVLINPNPMNIKIEHKFNPVEAPKQESIEKNETVTRDEAQAPSTSLQV